MCLCQIIHIFLGRNYKPCPVKQCQISSHGLVWNMSGQVVAGIHYNQTGTVTAQTLPPGSPRGIQKHSDQQQTTRRRFYTNIDNHLPWSSLPIWGLHFLVDKYQINPRNSYKRGVNKLSSPGLHFVHVYLNVIVLYERSFLLSCWLQHFLRSRSGIRFNFQKKYVFLKIKYSTNVMNLILIFHPQNISLWLSWTLFEEGNGAEK